MGSGEGLVNGQAKPIVVRMPAELNVTNAWPIGDELASIFVSGSATVIVDLTATNSCDSAGLAVLALVHYKALANNAELRLVAPSAAVRHGMVLAGLDRVLRIYPSLAEALRANGKYHNTVEWPAEERIYKYWISALRKPSGSCPALLVPDPAQPAPGVFRIFATGPALLRFTDGLNGFCSSWPEGLDDEYSGLISTFFEDLRKWINVSGRENSVRAEPDVSRALDEHIKDLASAGFTVGARERFLRLVGGIGAEPLSWRIADIKVQLAI